MPRYKTGKKPPIDELLRDVADRGGVFSAREAEDRGISRQLLSYYVKEGKLDRLDRGIYRSKYAPDHPHEDAIESAVAYGPKAVVSGSSALNVYGIGTLDSNKICIKHPADEASARIPSTIAASTMSIVTPDDYEVSSRDGVPIEPVLDALSTAWNVGNYDPNQFVNTVRDALNAGTVSRSDLKERDLDRFVEDDDEQE